MSLGGPDSRTGSCWSTTRGTRVRNLTPSLLDLISELLANENKCADISNTSAGSVKMCRPGAVSGETSEEWCGIFISSEESEQISARVGPETHSLPHQDYFFLHIKLVSRSQHAVLFFFII